MHHSGAAPSRDFDGDRAHFDISLSRDEAPTGETGESYPDVAHRGAAEHGEPFHWASEPTEGKRA